MVVTTPGAGDADMSVLSGIAEYAGSGELDRNPQLLKGKFN
jgi:hypothetical protein